MNIDEIIKNSSFKIVDGYYNVAKVSGECDADKCFMIVKDDLETTVIYDRKQKIDKIISEQIDYKLIAINVAVPFFSTGFIATISSSFSKNNISVLVVSTFSRDYFMVKTENLYKAEMILIKLGLIKL